jgi:hypothetical protein
MSGVFSANTGGLLLNEYNSVGAKGDNERLDLAKDRFMGVNTNNEGETGKERVCMNTDGICRIMQSLREKHGCDRQRYKQDCSTHQFEECYHTLLQYIFECRQYQLQICNGCRRNRL